MESNRLRRRFRPGNLTGLAFILPALIFLLAFVLYPLIYNIRMSFLQVDVSTLYSEQPFVGLKNYIDVLTSKLFRSSLINTFVFTIISIVFQFIIGFALALLFSKPFPGNNFLRGLMLICWMIPILVATSVWKWMFAGDTSGVINYLLIKLGILKEPISWLTNATTAMAALVISNIWRGVPFNMLLLATAITTLPEEIYEAAEIDGASRFQRFRTITLPLLRPAIFSVITLGFIYTFKVFEIIFIMTNGGPVNTTHNLATLSYLYSFRNFEYAQGATIATVLFAILMVFGSFYIKLSEGDDAS